MGRKKLDSEQMSEIDNIPPPPSGKAVTVSKQNSIPPPPSGEIMSLDEDSPEKKSPGQTENIQSSTQSLSPSADGSSQSQQVGSPSSSVAPPAEQPRPATLDKWGGQISAAPPIRPSPAPRSLSKGMVDLFLKEDIYSKPENQQAFFDRLQKNGTPPEQVEYLKQLGADVISKKENIGKLREEVNKDHTNTKASQELGKELADVGKFDEADQLFYNVLKHNPRSNAALQGLAYTAANRGDAEGAKELYQQAFETSIDNGLTHPELNADIEALHNKAQLQSSTGDQAGAEKTLQQYQSVKKKKDDLQYLAGLGKDAETAYRMFNPLGVVQTAVEGGVQTAVEGAKKINLIEFQMDYLKGLTGEDKETHPIKAIASAGVGQVEGFVKMVMGAMVATTPEGVAFGVAGQAAGDEVTKPIMQPVTFLRDVSGIEKSKDPLINQLLGLADLAVSAVTIGKIHGAIESAPKDIKETISKSEKGEPVTEEERKAAIDYMSAKVDWDAIHNMSKKASDDAALLDKHNSKISPEVKDLSKRMEIAKLLDDREKKEKEIEGLDKTQTTKQAEEITKINGRIEELTTGDKANIPQKTESDENEVSAQKAGEKTDKEGLLKAGGEAKVTPSLTESESKKEVTRRPAPTELSGEKLTEEKAKELGYDNIHEAFNSAKKRVEGADQFETPGDMPVEFLEEAKKSREAVNQEEKLIGLTKAIDIPERIEARLTDSDKLYVSKERKKQWEQIKKDIHSGVISPDKTIADIISGEKEPSDTDMLVMLHKKVGLTIAHDEVSGKIKEANGNPLDQVHLELRKEAVEKEQKDLLTAIDFARSKAGSLLQSVQAFSTHDYDYVSLKHSLEKEQGEKLSKDQEEKIKKISEDHEQLQRQYKELQGQMDKQKEEQRATVEREIVEKNKPKDKLSKEQRIKDQAKIIANNIRKGKLSRPDIFSAATPASLVWDGAIELTAKAIETGGDIGQAIADGLSHIKNSDWYRSASKETQTKAEEGYNNFVKEKQNINNSLKERVKNESEGVLHEGLKPILDKMVKNLVVKGINTIEGVVDAIHADIKEDIPGVTKEEIRDMVSGYGKFKPLSKDEVVRQISELKLQGRLNAKVEATERGELPLRNGFERAEQTQQTREKNAQILKNIKEKGIEPQLTDDEKAAQYKSSTEAHHRRLQNAIDDIQKEIDTGERKAKSDKKAFTDERSKELEADKQKLIAIRDAIFAEPKKTEGQKKAESIQKRIDDIRSGKTKEPGKEPVYTAEEQAEIDKLNKELEDAKRYSGQVPAKPLPEDIRTKALEKGIKQIESEINDLKAGQIPKEKGAKIPATNPRIRELESLREGLKQELSDLTPQETKDKAILNKVKKQREKRLAALEEMLQKGKTDPSVFESKLKKPPIKGDAALAELDLKIKQNKAKFDYEKEKVKLANRGRVEKAIDNLSRYQRFMIFLNPWGMGRLAYAAMFRPIMKIPTEIAKLALSNIPVTKDILSKSPGMYRPTVGSAARSTGKYYSTLLAKKTFKDAASEYNRRSNYSILKESENRDKYNTKAEFVLSAPEMTHGFLKSFPKIAAHEATYQTALENLSNTINPQTGEHYDITDPSVRQIAMDEAVREARAEVFMSTSELSKATKNLLGSLSTSENFALQVSGLYGKQLEPVIKVPANFYHEVLQQFPVIGMLDAAQIVARAGEKGAKNQKNGTYRGIKNLTPEQAHKASRALVNQAMGIMVVGAGIALYKAHGDDLIKKIEKYKYWAHNTALPLLMMGLHMGKETGMAPVIKTGVEETVKLPQVKAAKEVASLSFSAAQAAAGKTTWEKASKKEKEMLAALLVPAGAAELAKRMDNERKRDPETFKEILEMRIPGMRDNVPEDIKGERRAKNKERRERLIEEGRIKPRKKRFSIRNR